MVKLYDTGVYLLSGKEIVCDDPHAAEQIKHKTGKQAAIEQAKRGTIAYSILKAHNTSSDEAKLQLKFDALTSHDITYVGIIQTARASGMTEFPVPYVLTNCHNSLCAVGGTINEDDHMFALSAAKKYGGVYVPANLAVIHSYNREMMSKCGRMILGSDSHTRYGALGTMAVGEGGGELAKQLLRKTYDLAAPAVIGVYLAGKPQPGVGPQDVALSIIGKVYDNSYVKNKVMEFIGDGVYNLDVEFRNSIDVMTTETTCWSSIWCTDEKVRHYYEVHGRPEDYRELKPAEIAYYDGLVYVDLAKIKPTIAMPFHPSNIYTIEELKANPLDIMHKVQTEARQQIDNPDITLDLVSKVRNGEIYVDQGLVAGCSGGTYDNIVAAANILDGQSTGNGVFTMSVYPGSQPAYIELVKNGAVAALMDAGVIVREAFCGPCFGAGDTPANQEFSIRHTTRNFPNREGSKPNEGQISCVALMDARSIAATARNGGKLTAATELDTHYHTPAYAFNRSIYDKRVYNGVGKADLSVELKFGPNIKDWPVIPSLTDHLLIKVISYITDPVTTTDELIPSGETSAFRSNPLRLAEFTLSRKDPAYVGKAKAVQQYELKRETGEDPSLLSEELKKVYAKIKAIPGYARLDAKKAGIGSTIFASKPGDGSAREQAASCQRVLGAWANLAGEYATKRYRSNLINWGMIPFLVNGEPKFRKDEYIFIPDVKAAILDGRKEIKAFIVGENVQEISLSVGDLTSDEKDIITAGCLINYYRE
ncbi:hydratase [Acetonema longum]|uniref:Putative hydratase n=1 Tax=Acetonema longum DSM 6540 TaxID=1009370 RepID=F7NGL3_9FIRM|nr:hydratase [Acetonema longum]EGO64817.1 putative hydratase [Acetonema longum DSM 6540]